MSYGAGRSHSKVKLSKASSKTHFSHGYANSSQATHTALTLVNPTTKKW